MDAQNEIFEFIPIPEYSRLYQISNIGNVRSIKRNIIMKTSPRNGYESICLSHNNTKKNYLIHRLVAITFIENPYNLDVVNHKDGNKTNNHVSNLEWVTHSENAQHSITTLNNSRSTVPVRQLDTDGNIVAVFDSIKEAELLTGTSAKKIPAVCNGTRLTTGGFKWEYVNDISAEAPDGKEIESFPGYIITGFGTVYSNKTKRYLALKQHESGYMSVALSNGSKKDFYVHVLVATLFLDPIPGKTYVNHKDRNKANNNVSNLEWVTASENNQHAFETGTNTYSRAVIMCDNDGNELKEFAKIRDAFLESGVDSSSIVRVCKGKQKTAGGYKWKYK